MFKKTKMRSILELLGKDLSGREVSKVLGVSRNTVAEVQALFEASDKTWDDISSFDDDRLYDLFYPDKFKYKIRYAAVDYSYVHKELKKTGVTLKLLWEEYSDKCVSDGVKPCSYITFTKNYKKYTTDKNYTSHVEHKPGIEIEVDWSGPTNLIITGPTGAGKTYLSCALGIEACKQIYRVLYIRMPDLMRNFENQRDNLRELTKYRKRIGNYHLLILEKIN